MKAIAETNPGAAIQPSRAAWRSSAASLAVLLVLVLLLYRNTAVEMVLVWLRSETFTHGFLVLPIALFLAWRLRDRVVANPPEPLPWALLPIAAVSLAFLVADAAIVNAASQFAMVALVVLSVLAVTGWRATRVLAFPLGFLFFAVPFGEFLIPPFMEWTADFTVAALRLTGIPVFREGLQFVIPSGSWSVVEACSGVRYLIASTMVGTLFAYLNYQSRSRRLCFVAVSVLVPIVANWLRAYLIVLLGHYSNNALAAGADHLIYGWLFFGVVIALMFAVGARWSEPATAQNHGSEPAAPGAPVAAVRTRLVVTGAALIVAFPHAMTFGLRAAEDASVPILAEPDLARQNWVASDAPTVSFEPSFTNPSAVVQRTYAMQERSVGLYLAYYRNQSPQGKLVSSENVLIRSSNAAWSRIEAGIRRIDLPAGPLYVRTARLRPGGAVVAGGDPSRLAVWQFYWVGGTLTGSDAAAKVWGAVHRLRGRGDAGAAIVVYAPETLHGAADAVLEGFVRANLPALDAHLRGARDGH